MTRRLDSIIRGLLSPMNPNATIILGAFTTLWGLWIVSPFWKVFNSAPLFSKVQDFAPEWAWGAWAICCGLLLVVGIKKDNIPLISFSLGFHVWHWFVISGLLWWGDWHNTGGLTYTFIGFYSLWSYLNFRLNFVGKHPFCWGFTSKLVKLWIKIWRCEKGNDNITS